MMKKILLSLLLTLGLCAGVQVGDQAKAFTLKSLDNQQTYSMADLKGEVVLVNIWASWCKGCKKEMPEFFDLQKQYKKGFKIVTISVDENAKKAATFLKSVEHKKGFKTPFISLYDDKKQTVKSYECEAMPSSYLIDKNAVIQEIIIGSLNHDDIQALKHKIDTLK
jgi:peroxiredoxin